MSIKIKMTLMSGFFLAVILLLSFFGYLGVKDLSHKLDNVAMNQLPAVRNMTLVDMMHDGLRAVAYRSLYLSSLGNTNSAEEKAENKKA